MINALPQCDAQAALTGSLRGLITPGKGVVAPGGRRLAACPSEGAAGIVTAAGLGPVLLSAVGSCGKGSAGGLGPALLSAVGSCGKGL